MSRGKYLSLEEARNSGRIDQFCKEHHSRGDAKRFDNWTIDYKPIIIWFTIFAYKPSFSYWHLQDGMRLKQA